MGEKVWLPENVQELKTGLWIVVLGVCAWTDMKKKYVGKRILFVTAILLGGMTFLSGQNISVMQSFRLLPGALLLILSFLSREKIGYGDGICVALSGLALPGNIFAQSLIYSFALILLLCLGLIFSKKATLETTLPYIPFLFAGTCMGILVQ